MTGETEPVPPPGGVVGSVPVKLYIFNLFGPPQNSEPFPLHVMLQSPIGVGAPPLAIVEPQSVVKCG